MTRRERRERERAAEAAARARAGETPGQPSQERQSPSLGQGQSSPQRPAPADGQTQAMPAAQPAAPSSSQRTSQRTGSRPVIRPAERTSMQRIGSGPSHQDSVAPIHQTQAYQGQAYQSPAPQTQVFPQNQTFAAHQAHPQVGGAAATATTTSAAAGGTRSRRQKPEYEPLGFVRGTIRTFGELCITAGLILILFVVWQLWWTDIAANRDNEVLADQLITDWRDNPANELPDDPDTPYVAEPVDENTGFGIMYVPRFGDDYYRTVAEGVSLEPVLNRMGVGRYPSSAMPGEVGNFAMAGHRVTYGKPLNQIHQLRPGDEIVIQTADGFYTYTFRNFEIVLPDATEVLAAVPTMPDYKGKDRIMTLTACNPMFSARERFIAYAELTDWTPAGEGAPAAIADSSAFDKVGGQS